jgi:hypothetical protein
VAARAPRGPTRTRPTALTTPPYRVAAEVGVHDRALFLPVQPRQAPGVLLPKAQDADRVGGGAVVV